MLHQLSGLATSTHTSMFPNLVDSQPEDRQDPTFVVSFNSQLSASECASDPALLSLLPIEAQNTNMISLL